MKTFILCGSAAGVIFLVWFLFKSSDRPPAEMSGGQTVARKVGTERQSKSSWIRTSRKPKTASSALDEQAGKTYLENVRKDINFDWKQPINFYGRVFDEKEQPIAGAIASFVWNDLSEKGTSEASTRSDANGYFLLENKSGKGLSVTVGKDGYYTPNESRQASYEYANPFDGIYRPDRNHPVKFHIRKKGPGTDLLTSELGMDGGLAFSMSLDGIPVWVDMLARKAGPTGQLKISQIKPPYEGWKVAAGWSFRMEIADGGFIEHDDEFPFEAPGIGYQPVLEFSFQNGETNWTALKKNYYIAFGNPRIYGRVHVETSVLSSGARIQYVINPTGSRDLEPKNTK